MEVDHKVSASKRSRLPLVSASKGSRLQEVSAQPTSTILLQIEAEEFASFYGGRLWVCLQEKQTI